MRALLILLVATIALNAQDHVNSFTFSAKTKLINCPSNPDETIVGLKDIEFYQTENDEWDGPLVEQCLSVDSFSRNSRVFYGISSYLNGKAVFVKFESEEEILLHPDQLYGVQFNIAVNNRDGSNFYSADIGYVQVNRSIPSEDGLSKVIRQHDFFNPSQDEFETFPCIATEYFIEGNLFENAIYKVNTTELPDGALLFSPYLFIHRLFIQTIADEVKLTLTTIGDYTLWGDQQYNNLALHENGLYPKEGNITVLPVVPEPNTETPQQINWVLDDYYSLHLQPYTTIEAGLAENGEPHQLSITNENSHLCLSEVVELRFNGDDVYYLQRANAKMDLHATACLSFSEGAAFTLGENVRAIYGRNGEGMLALRSGGTIELLPGSELIFDGTLWMCELRDEGKPNKIFMDLPEGTTLRFTENAVIHNQYSFDGTINLNIYMRGGLLDDSSLDAKSRALINPIYPENLQETIEYIDPANVFFHAEDRNIQVEFNSPVDSHLSLQMIDLQGKLLCQQSFEVYEGFNFIEMPACLNGIGLISIRTNNNTSLAVKKYFD